MVGRVVGQQPGNCTVLAQIMPAAGTQLEVRQRVRRRVGLAKRIRRDPRL
jgi:hypothetical protein